ncbi:DsbA family protein [Phaeovibrio sulfidiphilus]|uniref:DsbA family protein n=1 Tax=Phaeovibrio sulfidiphilus TaxID=1220600 RepID=A0A8J7CBQ7_9PROT|nr:DsbA family protein [Phaeovibrio sulfidiphilus]MBE1236438.1 DsbA family protein [Phaeovibrio sulfidiphilus]
MTPFSRRPGPSALASLSVLCALLLSPVSPAPATAQTPQAATGDRDMGEQMRRAFLDDPTIVRDALMAYQRFEKEMEAQRTAAAASRLDEILQKAPGLKPFGNPKGDALVVEFSDYNCGYCKQASANLREVLKADPNVRLYVLEMPIFGQESLELARLALAAQVQGKYEALHWALMSQRGRVTTDTLLRLAKEQGLDVDRLKKDARSNEVEQTLDISLGLARDFGVSGTPAFIIGNQLIPGALPTNTILELLREARKAP